MGSSICDSHQKLKRRSQRGKNLLPTFLHLASPRLVRLFFFSFLPNFPRPHMLDESGLCQQASRTRLQQCYLTNLQTGPQMFSEPFVQRLAVVTNRLLLRHSRRDWWQWFKMISLSKQLCVKSALALSASLEKNSPSDKQILVVWCFLARSACWWGRLRVQGGRGTAWCVCVCVWGQPGC